jgi:glycosyltransferase involved in cell wall biosynthesis
MVKISVVIPTLGRDTLYPLISNLLKQKVGYSYEILLIPQVRLKEDLLIDEKIKVFYELPGKGFAYYRNVGINKSKGKILVFVDDDELPMNLNWLNELVKPIISQNEKVVTAGVKINLNQGYFTDSISLLGFPGGGAIGFKTMWRVDSKGYTKHLCSGNLAIRSSIMRNVGNFKNFLKSGSEDVYLAEKLTKQNIRIRYLGKATIHHIARGGFLNFIRWNFLRGKSAAEYMKSKKSKGNVSNRVSSSKKILLKTIKTKYFPGVLFMMFNQYLWQTLGYIFGR